MFSLRDFIRSGMLKAVGHMADYAIILNAAGWLDKGVLTEEDLAELQTAIEAQYMTEDPTAEDEANIEEAAEEHELITGEEYTAE